MNKQHQPHRTIAAAAVSFIKAYEMEEAGVVVKAVKKEFPESKFNRGQFHYYRSMLECGRVDGMGRRGQGRARHS